MKRMLKSLLKGGAFAAALTCVVSTANAQDPSDDSVVQNLAHGQVDWSAKRVTATGSGAANLKDTSVAVARLKAERAAKLDALRNIIETVQGIQVNAKLSAGDLMSNGEVRTKVVGMAQNFKVVDTKYYSDGSVDIVVSMPLDGKLSSALFSGVKETGTRKVSTQGAATATGLVINAQGFTLSPSMAPRIVDEAGREVYGASLVSDAGLSQGGIVSYAKNVKMAKNSDRAGKKPMMVKALRVAEGTKTDIVISNADADKLRDPKANLSFLSQGKVVVVID